MMFPGALRPACFILVVAWALTPRLPHAASTVDISLGKLAGPGWRAESPRAVLDLSGDRPVMRLSVAAVVSNAGERLSGPVELVCRGFAVTERYIACPRGDASVTLPRADTPLRTSIDFVLRRQDVSWRATGVAALGPGVAWRASGGDGAITVAAEADDLPLSAVQPWLPALPGGVVSLSGRLSSLEAELRLPAGGGARVEAHLAADGIGFDTEDGLLAAAGISGRMEIDWRGGGENWRAAVETRLQTGEFLAGTFYTSLTGAPLAVSGTLEADGARWRVQGFELADADAISLAGDALWDWSAERPLREMDARLKSLVFPGAYGNYLQPILAQYGFGNLATAGGIEGEVRIHDGEPAAFTLSLNHLDISDSQGRLEFVDLNGTARWRAEGGVVPSSLTWQDARVYSIPLGSADIRAEAVADDFRLTRQTLLPVLDGALVINALEMEDWFGERPRLLFDARLMPISLAALSDALGWPELQGTLAGRIPELTFRDGVYRLGGSLVVDVFDGTILVENLRLERPFGVLPKLVADIRLNELSLEKLTGVFTIGRITGRIAGYVRNLRMLDWRPVHFDARLATPEDDDTEHRISQRAVDTLTSLGGGGAGGALSRTFLRIFDEFAYEQLGITCRLEDGVCHMAGVKPAPNGGYYIVEGAGLPRVDVIGYVRRVDWPRLLDQLVEAMQGQAPTLGAPPGRSGQNN